MLFPAVVAALLGSTAPAPPEPFVRFGLRAEAMGSLAVAGLVSGLGGAGRASALLSLGDHVDLQLNLLAAWASGPAVRFEYFVSGVAVLSFGLVVAFMPG